MIHSGYGLAMLQTLLLNPRKASIFFGLPGLMLRALSDIPLGFRPCGRNNQKCNIDNS
jgi:hypothetical protein